MSHTTSSGCGVAVLGTGLMGSGMARSLAEKGLRTTVWDRSETTTTALADAGVAVAPSPRDAIRGARVVIAVLAAADVVDSVIFGDGVAEALACGAVWVQMGTADPADPAATIGIADWLGQMRPDVMVVDARVPCGVAPAGAGHPVILASGPSAAEAVLRPVFYAIGRGTVWLPPAGQAA
jgi:3-hydroxyisobutyrate dehydrogenase